MPEDRCLLSRCRVAYEQHPGRHFPLPNADLLVHCDMIVGECDFITHLHLVEQPVWIAL
jgi:hypothetical protein